MDLLIRIRGGEGTRDEIIAAVDEALTSLIETVDAAQACVLIGGQSVLVTGNPVDGFEFFGPFPYGDEATEFAESAWGGAYETWWVAPLSNPCPGEGPQGSSSPEFAVGDALRDEGRQTAEDYLYEKCALCHLFIEPNDSIEGRNPEYEATLALYLHNHRGDEADEALDESHEATPSGMKATLATWQAYGPPEMRARFTPDNEEEEN